MHISSSEARFHQGIFDPLPFLENPDPSFHGGVKPPSAAALYYCRDPISRDWFSSVFLIDELGEEGVGEEVLGAGHRGVIFRGMLTHTFPEIQSDFPNNMKNTQIKSNGT